MTVAIARVTGASAFEVLNADAVYVLDMYDYILEKSEEKEIAVTHNEPVKGKGINDGFWDF